MRRLIGHLLASFMFIATATASAQTPAAETPVTVKLQSFSVIVRDYDEALAWYTDKLGFATIRDQRFGANERFIMVAPTKTAETAIVLQHAKGSGQPNMPASYEDRLGKQVNIVLNTSDVTATYERMRARGVSFHQEPRQMPWGGEALFKDLYGNSFVLVGPLHARK
jgi:uncharacterized glyoxalase superfamily protein PhnB